MLLHYISVKVVNKPKFLKQRMVFQFGTLHVPLVALIKQYSCIDDIFK